MRDSPDGLHINSKTKYQVVHDQKFIDLPSSKCLLRVGKHAGPVVQSILIGGGGG